VNFPTPLRQEGGGFYDLEFCLWLHRNFDYITAHHKEWEAEKTFTAEQRKVLTEYMGMTMATYVGMKR
jgi:hypothetical protein